MELNTKRTNPGFDARWRLHPSFCQFAGPLQQVAGVWSAANAVAIRPGKIDRSPTGTGCSARMAVLHAKGQMRVGDRYLARSIIGSEFACHIEAQTLEAQTRIGTQPAIVPVVSGSAWITGTHQHTLDPSDPYPCGYRLSATWPMLG